MSAYLYNAPTGIPGNIVSADESAVEPAKLIAVSSVYAQAFGIPMKYASGGISQFASGDTAAAFAGILVREAPSISGNALSGLTDTIPNPTQVNGMCTRGYVNVKCTVGTPARGGVVYVRVVADTGKAIGDLEATSDGSNSVALSLTQASWATDGKDADGNTVLRVAR